MDNLYGHEYMKVGCNCAQATLVSLAKEAGLTKDEAMKMACPFGGGCRAGEICGAAVGALLALGQVFGNTNWEDKETRQKADALAVQFNQWFKAKYGVVTCRELTGVDTSTPEGKQYFHDHPEIKEKICFHAVDDSIEKMKKIITENK